MDIFFERYGNGASVLRPGDVEVIAEAMNRLIPRLNPRSPRDVATPLRLNQALGGITDLFLARDRDCGDRVVGMAILVRGDKVTAYMCHMEDVVVEPGYEGQHIATTLVKMVQRVVKSDGNYRLNCSSRDAAAVYVKLGFQVVAQGRTTFLEWDATGEVQAD